MSIKLNQHAISFATAFAIVMLVGASAVVGVSGVSDVSEDKPDEVTSIESEIHSAGATVIVQAGDLQRSIEAVTAVGGAVTLELDAIGGVAAWLTEEQLEQLRDMQAEVQVTRTGV